MSRDNADYRADPGEENQVTYDLAEHRHRFAGWAAARAAQRNFTSVKNLRAALQATDIRRVLSDPQTLQLSQDQFNNQHRKWCRAICSRLATLGIKNATYGRAAKLVAVYLKATVIMAETCDSSLGRSLHPPIDRVLLRALASSTEITSRHQTEWRSINWTQLEEKPYYELIGQLREALPPGAPFWTIEEYWQPSDSDDDGS
jgi:hypothetical protein